MESAVHKPREAFSAASQAVPSRFHVLAKPTGATCNLACSYCFFLDKGLLYPNSKFRMTANAPRTDLSRLAMENRV